MKKVALILLISIYAISTLGVGLKEFYCSGKLKSISISIVPDAKQKCGNGDDKSGCCKNKYQYIKVKDSHVKADYIGSAVKVFTVPHTFTSPFKIFLLATPQLNLANRSNAPPLHPGVPDYIFNCVFRI
jgi:hypothetical protein